MFDLNNNAFFMLGVTPDANENDIVEAYEDVVSEHPDKEHELQKAQNNLRIPKKRLLEELTYLWGLSPEHWMGWITKSREELIKLLPSVKSPTSMVTTSRDRALDAMDALVMPSISRVSSSTLSSWDGLTEVARMNLASHYCYSTIQDSKKVKVAQNFHGHLENILFKEILIVKTLEAQIRGICSYTGLFDVIKVNRKMAQMPTPQEAQYNKALEVVRVMHRKAAMHALEQAVHGGRDMTKIVERWRYDNSESGRFVSELCHDYDRWSIDKLRPIEENIDIVIELLREETMHANLSRDNNNNRSEDEHQMELDELEKLLSGWDEYSQPVQLMNEAKGLDDRRSKEICGKLRMLAIDFHNIGMSKQSLRISQALLSTFPELPGVVGLLASDVTTLKNITKREEITKSVKEWVEFVNRIKANTAMFVRDIQQGASGKQWPAQVTDFINKTEIVLKNYSQDETIWYFAMSLATHIRAYGSAQEALFYLKLIEIFASRYQAPAAIVNELKMCITKQTHSPETNFQFRSGATEFPKSQNISNDLYSSDWNEINKRVKRLNGYTCEICHIVLNEPFMQKYLHCHHIHGDRHDNQHSQLQCLCIKCHAEQPNHGHLTKHPDYDQFLPLWDNWHNPR